MSEPTPAAPVGTPAAADLLPCPFCGGTTAAINERPFSRHTPGVVKHLVICHTCGAETLDSFDCAEAVAAWNRRSDAAIQAERAGREAAERERDELRRKVALLEQMMTE